MVETFTPDVCGSRRRQRLALAYFALGAFAASALVGAGLVALGGLLPAALCFAAFGLGRTLMTVSARRGHADPTAAVEALVRRRRLLLRANVLALLVCAGLLAAPAAGASRSLGPGLDPAARSTV